MPEKSYKFPAEVLLKSKKEKTHVNVSKGQGKPTQKMKMSWKFSVHRILVR